MMFLDKLRDVITGLGGGKDKSAGAEFVHLLVSQAELDAMHRSDWLARKIVDIIPQDMVREWRSWQADAEDIEKLEAVERTLAVSVKVMRALQAARLYGGAALVMGIGTQKPEEELDPETVKAGDLRFLHMMNRYELSAAGGLIRNIESPWYGEPEFYQVNATGTEQIKIHPSRVIRFTGAEVMNTHIQNTDGWGDSVLQVVYTAVKNAASSQEHVAALIPEAKVDVIHVPELSKHLANQETTKRLTDRFQYANMIKSMFSFQLLEGNGKDQGELWHQKTISFSEFPELVLLYIQVAAGAADIPVTRLLGQSPSGLSATGESDMRNYYDNVGARRRHQVMHPLERLDEVLIRSALGRFDDAITTEWPSLWQIQPGEAAEIAERHAKAAEIYANTGLIPDAALARGVQNRLVEGGEYPGLEQALEEFGSDPDDLSERVPEEDPEDDRRSTADAEPRTLYVHRKVLNADAILAWAKEQGFKETLSADDLHVTIMFSRRPVDWLEIGEAWESEVKITEGGPRLVGRYGEASVLKFGARDLMWRHEYMVRMGASWEHAEYEPHITISYDPDAPEIDEIEPYQGEILLGPEMFSEIETPTKVTGT